MKKYLSIIAITSFMFVATVVLAEESTGAYPKPYLKDRPQMNSAAVKPRPAALPLVNRQEFNAKLEESREALKAGEITREEFQAQVKTQMETFRAELKTKLEAFKAEVKNKKEEFKNATLEMKQKFRENVQNMIGQRFESAFANLERMQARVGSLIDKLEGEDKDTGNAEEYLNDSKDSLAAAKSKLAEIKKLLPASGEEVSAETFEKIKLGARETKDLLKESHNSLVQAIKELKGLRADGEEQDNDEDKDEDGE